MIYFKACPRCKGDVVEEKDHYGRYWQCFQCGHMMYSPPSKTPDGHRGSLF